MNKVKFWFVQIMLLAIVSLAFGPSAIAAPKSKGIETSTAEATEDIATHGEDMRQDKANLEKGKADWKNGDTPPDPAPVCTRSNTSGCTIETCGPEINGGMWDDIAKVCSFF